MKINKKLLAAILSACFFTATSAHAVQSFTLDGSDLNFSVLPNTNLDPTNTSGVSWIDTDGEGHQDVLNEESNAFTWTPSVGESPTMTSPVPEPETYVMLLAGLGLLSFIAKRRKQAA